MDTNKTGRFIAELRKERGWIQKELAAQLAVTDKAVSRWETGKGLPDTALLKPLADLLGVSVGELLAGRRLDPAEVGDQTDRVILDALDYSKRMLADTAGLLLYILGAALTVSPLFMAGRSALWIPGLVILGLAVLYTAGRKGGRSVKITEKRCYAAAMALQAAALVLEILPVGVVMDFAAGPEERFTELYSYFSQLPLGYANFTPMLTGLLTLAVLLLGAVALTRFDRAARIRKRAFTCGILALLCSLGPLLIYGTGYMNWASYGISGAILLSLGLQALANRQE